MKEFVEKLIERLEELKKIEYDREDYADKHDYYEDWEDAFEDGKSNGKHYAYSNVIKIVNQLAEEYNPSKSSSFKNGWIPCSEFPKTDKYILLSFSNYTVPIVGRYEEDEKGGAFYIGDEDESCCSQCLFVNAWQPLPEPYKPAEKQEEIQPNYYTERFNRVM